MGDVKVVLVAVVQVALEVVVDAAVVVVDVAVAVVDHVAVMHAVQYALVDALEHVLAVPDPARGKAPVVPEVVWGTVQVVVLLAVAAVAADVPHIVPDVLDVMVVLAVQVDVDHLTVRIHVRPHVVMRHVVLLVVHHAVVDVQLPMQIQL